MVHVPTRLSDEREVPVRLGPVDQERPRLRAEQDAPRRRTPIRCSSSSSASGCSARRWLLAGRSEQITGPGDWLSFESHGETVVITRQPEGRLAAFHNVCRTAARRSSPSGRGAVPRRFTCPYHGWMYDTHRQGVGRARAGRLRPRAPRRTCAARRSRPTSGAAGSGSTWPAPTPPRRCRTWIGEDIIARPRPVPTWRTWCCSTSSSGTCRSATRRSSTASTRSTTPPSCTTSTPAWTKSARDTTLP